MEIKGPRWNAAFFEQAVRQTFQYCIHISDTESELVSKTLIDVIKLLP